MMGQAWSLGWSLDHHFSDASEVGYGAVTYLRIQDQEGIIHCSFVRGKARVAPVKAATIPRLEPAAATVAVHLGAVIKRQLDIPVDSVTFWTDSTTVLRYINNKTSRFKAYLRSKSGGNHSRTIITKTMALCRNEK